MNWLRRTIVFIVVTIFVLVVVIIYRRHDGKLHIVFCDVGQGDAIYLKLPNGADVLVDGGPKDAVLECLGKYMSPFDRSLDLVIATHPQKDHIHGLVTVLKRYTTANFATTPIAGDIEEYEQIKKTISQQHIASYYLTNNESIIGGEVVFKVLWPEVNWLLNQPNIDDSVIKNSGPVYDLTTAKSDLDLNMFSLYLHLNYKNFDLLLTGDGDSHVQEALATLQIGIPKSLEVLKVPHHGSKTGMTEAFIEKVRPKFSIIQVGKNSYGHPSKEIIEKLSRYGTVLRNDTAKTIEVVTDGSKMEILD